MIGAFRELYLNAPLAPEHLCFSDRLRDNINQVEALKVEADLVGFGTREEKQVLDEPRKFSGAIDHLRQRGAIIRFRPRRRPKRDFSFAAKRRERRTQLMAYLGQK